MKKGLCEICSPKQWKTLSSSELTESGYPVYGANGIIGYYPEFNHEKETILVTCRGATCGSLNICKPFSYTNGNAMALDNLSKEVDLKYLYYYLQYRGFKDVITGSAQPQIVRQSLKKVEVCYPELDKQKQIVYSLEKAEMMIAKRELQILKLDQLVKSQFIEMFGNPVENERGFKTCKIGELFKVRSSKRVYQSQLTTNGVPFYKVADLISQIDGGIQACKTFITQELFDDFSDKGLVPKTGDILMTTRGTIGKCYIFEENDKFYFQDGMISWFQPITDKILPEFFVELFENESFQPAIEASINHTTVTYASLEKLSQIPIICPDIEIQKQFIRIEQQADKSKFAIQQSLEKMETLKKSLMQEYFG